MAEVTAMRNNATSYPVYGVAWTIVFPFLDADGDTVSAATTPDAEVSKNGDTFADCTNESTEIATNSGIYYLTLTATEMSADIVTVQAKSATAGMKTTIAVLYPRKLVTLSTGTCQGSNDTGDIQLASGDSAIDDYYNGCLCVAVIDGTTEARIINDYVGSTKVGEVSPAWNTAQPDSNDTYTIYLPEGRQVQQANTTHLGGTAQTGRDIGASVLLSSGTGTGQVTLTSGRVNADITHISAAAVSTSTAQLGVNVVNAGGTAWASGSLTSGVFATGAITATAIAADAIGASELATDAVQEIRNAITGGAYALDTDVNGRIRIVDGTAAGEIDTSSGGIAHVILTDTLTTYTGNTPQTGDAYAQTNSGTFGLSAIKGYVDDIGVAGAGLSAIPDLAGVTTLLSRLTSARAGYLDNINNSGLSTLSVSAIWQDTTAGDFTAANSIGKSIMNGVALGTGLTINAYTGDTPQTGDSYARIGATGSGLTSLAQSSIWTSTVAGRIDAAISTRSTLTQAQVTGGAYAFDTDANGRIRIVDGTGAGELDTSSGKVTLAATQTFDNTGTWTGSITGAVGSISSGGIDAAAITTAAGNKLADMSRRRTQANVEASSYGDTLDLSSAYGFIQQAQESSISGATLSVWRTDGSTLLGTKSLTSNSSAEPITGVA